MRVREHYAVALAASLLMGTAALAASPNDTSMSPQMQTADKDFGKLSKDGVKAFADLRLARLAIFDGDTSQAKTLIDDAQTSLNAAKSDDTVFTKAEADLKPAPGTQQKASETVPPSTTKIAWIPVDGQITLGEDYVASPEKQAGVTKADTQLKQGDKKGAMDTLKLANVDVDFTEAVAPLNATINGVNKAAEEIDQGHYYEANQALKSVEDGVRFDSDIVAATPDKTSHS